MELLGQRSRDCSFATCHTALHRSDPDAPPTSSKAEASSPRTSGYTVRDLLGLGRRGEWRRAELPVACALGSFSLRLRFVFLASQASHLPFAALSPSSWQWVCAASLFLDPPGNFHFPGNPPMPSRFSD